MSISYLNKSSSGKIFLERCIDFERLEIYFITIPNTMVATEVWLACIAVNRKSRGHLYYTAEYSFNGYAVCSPDEINNHNISGLIAKDGAEFAKYCYKQAMEKINRLIFCTLLMQ